MKFILPRGIIHEDYADSYLHALSRAEVVYIECLAKRKSRRGSTDLCRGNKRTEFFWTDSNSGTVCKPLNRNDGVGLTCAKLTKG